MQNNSGKANWSIWALVAIVAVVTFFVVGPSIKKYKSESSEASVAKENLLQKIDSETLSEKMKTSDSKLKLVNLWATWCLPCVEEFPYLLKLRENYADKGLEVVFVSMDMVEEESRVQQFLVRHEVDFVSYLKNENDNEFINRLNKDWSGALPATFIYDQSGNQINFWTGDRTYEEFEKEILNLMN